MAERPDPTPMPDLRLTSDSRIPTNLGNIIGNCDTCDRPITQYINVAGCDGGNEKLCSPCYADYYDDSVIPHDDVDDWDDYDATVAKYNLQKMGKQQKLDCGCILMDFTFTHLYKIHLCFHHKVWCKPRILMTDLQIYASSCDGCDMAFPEHEMTICSAGWGCLSGYLCPECYKIHLKQRKLAGGE